MTRWAAFAGITVAVLSLLLVLARASQSMVAGSTTGVGVPAEAPRGPPTDDGAAAGEARDGSDRRDTAPPATAEAPGDTPSDVPADGRAGTAGRPADAPRSPDAAGRPRRDHGSPGTDHREGAGSDPVVEAASVDPEDDYIEPGAARFVRYGPEPPEREELTTQLLLANVAVSQGLLGALVVGGAWWAGVPGGALGVSSLGLGTLGTGIAFGAALSVANTLGGAAAAAFGYDPGEELRGLLAPDSPGGWALLLLVVLPVIAGFEEFLFRAALVGAFAAGFGVSPWVLAVLSSVAFALGHGAQGPAGIAVTGLLGFVLAAGFVVTGSLLVVVVAHYLVNAIEFVVYEGLGVEPLRP